MGIGLTGLAETIWAISGSAALVAIATILGDRILAAMRLRMQQSLERLVFAAGLGTGLLSYLAFALGALALLSVNNVRVVWLLCIVLSTTLMILLRSRSARPEMQADAGSSRDMPGWALMLLYGAGLFLLCALITCLTPVLDYDGLAYHLAAPKRWLELGGLRYLPTHLNTEWPMGFEMIYLLLLPLTGPAGCKPMILLTTLLTAAATYRLGIRIANRIVGVAAAGLFVLAAGADKIDTTSIEMPLTLFVTLSAMALAEWTLAADSRMQRRRLLMSAVFAGLGCCVKLNGLLCAALLTMAVLLLSHTGERNMTLRFKEAALFLGVAICCALPWYVRAWHDTGNPIYPFAYGLLGGRDWSLSAARELTDFFRYFNLPGPTLAARQAVLIRHLLKVSLLTLIVVALPAPRRIRGLALSAGAFTLAQIVSSDQIRFLLPALPLAVIVTAWWIVRIATRFPIVGWGVALAAGALALPGAAMQAKASLPSALGEVPPQAILRHNLAIYDACLWANRHLPADARVLAGLDERTYYLARDTYWSAEIVQRQIVYGTSEAFAASLRRAGIGYLLFNRSLARNPQTAFEIQVGWRDKELQRLTELASRSTPLWTDGPVTIYRLPADLAGR